ncbi:3-oxoacyl-[acyl-carrier-] synthase III family protein [Ehrlichia chaffeensis str. Heartland]|uniref:Beta-ketoacyl-[acyl-carrier-protein] synthase III n=1 Tax=Ehrlichia chaffeensis (strain ATCC CRL-10679 / Arkansas) TaxID=205920 RepID=FABH_EHRCR|nr:beta-ketoacyl-ACP synthase III [Ehrlichia chaffeensis]Q2GH17.1 RecName: Full=Beta-ketoacyl-[acyl-carrier-protein] synthase III; Short=Beta-ketoacyl-ACP synthase III; Short=KAS III; AltName: Full=3-oxoacyl-[acyl-carrier-protein] synthase 3; AltName: Full=3-oxoacyl-[acyl-carrier-protein] synthase III [Ehrlichia chaffeensis str. Arkansas]ABD45059.1 3-oxoacyl-(acyl-carrier-protein) synthase III [Ehrlichia chaffeensis str. Arkansas]AHX03547.1 3-oxoacyl-[acyl-carrier-] synthase III family protein [
MKRSTILGIGSYLPKKIVTNDELALTVETSDEWIVKRTGIKQRHIAENNEMTSDMAANAARLALTDACVHKDDIGLIIVATTTPDRTFPSCATIVQDKLECKNAFAFDIQAVCSGFVYAISIADNFIKSGQVNTALVIGAEIMSRILDWQDRSTCVLFGDGAGAVVLGNNSEKDSGIISTILHSDGAFCDLLYTTGGTAYNGHAGTICMNGTIVFEHAIEKLSASILEILDQNDLEINDVDWFVLHQANIRIIELVARRLKIPYEKMVVSVNWHGNTSAASIPLALSYAKSSGKLKKHDIAILAAIGGGFTWGTCLVRI